MKCTEYWFIFSLVYIMLLSCTPENQRNQWGKLPYLILTLTKPYISAAFEWFDDLRVRRDVVDLPPSIYISASCFRRSDPS